MLCGGKALGGRIGGPVLYFLTYKMYLGKSPERAAVSEYLYRVWLSIESKTFGTPHILGL